MRTISKMFEVEVVITVSDDAPEDAITRALTKEWADVLYKFNNEDEIMSHLGYNCIANGVEDAIRLDGWADLPPGSLTMLTKNIGAF